MSFRAEFARRAQRLIRPRRLGFLALALALLPASGRTASAQDAPRNVVYIQTSNANNTLLTYRRNMHGHLTLDASASALTGGIGHFPTPTFGPEALGVFDSDQIMVFNPAGNRLFTVNGGSDTIAVFDLRPNGKAVAVPGSPFPSGGRNPSSVGISGNILVVANKDYDIARPGFSAAARAPNYSTFRVDGRGRLTPAGVPITINPIPNFGPGSPVPTQVLISPNGRIVFDADFFGFRIQSFTLTNGQLRRADSQGFPASVSPAPVNPFGFAIPLGLQVHPKTNVLYVGQVLDNRTAVYDYDVNSGRLTFLNSIDNIGAGPCWYVTNKAGTRLYAANNFDNSISVYNITNPRRPVVIQRVTLQQGLNNAAPFQIALDPTERFFHVVTQHASPLQNIFNANSLQVLSVDRNGLLALVDAVFLPTFPWRPQGVLAR